MKINTEELILKVLKSHLAKVSFEKTNEQTIITITKQVGNEDGHIVEVILFSTGNIKGIRYIDGSYSSAETVHETLKEIFKLISESKGSENQG